MEAEYLERRATAYRVGITVLILLVAATIGEYFLGTIAVGWTAPLFLIAIFKAWFIVRDYMHLPRLFAEVEEEA
jgi:hypothetical protein